MVRAILYISGKSSPGPRLVLAAYRSTEELVLRRFERAPLRKTKQRICHARHATAACDASVGCALYWQQELQVAAHTMA